MLAELRSLGLTGKIARHRKQFLPSAFVEIRERTLPQIDRRQNGRLAAQSPDARRFRPNILITSLRSVPFEEDEWVGGVLSFGETDEAAAIGITNRDERCSMVNFDPDSARPTPEVLKAIVRMRDNKAGVYGTVTRRGRVAVGQPIFFEPAAKPRERP